MKSVNQYQDTEHPFAAFVRILGKGKKGSRSLTAEEAHDAMRMILNHDTLDLQLGAFLMLLRVKEESPEELAGFVTAVKTDIKEKYFNSSEKLKQDLNQINIDFDWPTYAGKRRHLPWFLLSIKILGQQGYKTLMHGTAGHTLNRVYTEEACHKLNIPVVQNISEIAPTLTKSPHLYCPLRCFSPRLDTLIHYRNILGLRSPVHTLTRLLNPFSAKVSLQSIFHPGYKPIHQEANRMLSETYSIGYQRVTVLKGEGGEFERNPESETLLQSVLNGELRDEKWPKLLEKRQVKPRKLDLEYLQQVWRNEAQDIYGEASIIGTLAITLQAIGAEKTIDNAQNLAQSLWLNRKKDL